MEDVYAAGDATDFPVKQGGLAAQQADAVALSIASSVDCMFRSAAVSPGLLTVDGTTRYMRAHLVSAPGDDGTVSERPLGGRRIGSAGATSRLTSAIGPAAAP
jgi:hypothetical protein